MILYDIPKVTKISLVETKEIALSNFKAVTFLVETKNDGDKLNVAVDGNTEGGTAKPIPFLFKKNGDAQYEEVAASGKEVTHTGEEPATWLVCITGDMLAHDELDRVMLKLTGTNSNTITTVYAFQSQPRFTSQDE